MARIYKATLAPSKLELLNAWLPSRPWAAGAGEVSQVGAYRFDDPDGEVGMEGFVLRPRTGDLMHVPVTYRATPMLGAEEHLVGTTEHSVLGTRWVYDACHDPVWATALASTVLTGGTQAEELVHSGDGPPVPREPSMTVQGTGTEEDAGPRVREVVCADDTEKTVVTADGLQLVVVRRIGVASSESTATLVGRWGPQGESGVLAHVTRTQESS